MSLLYTETNKMYMLMVFLNTKEERNEETVIIM